MNEYTLWPMPPALLIHTRSTMAALKWKHWTSLFSIHQQLSMFVVIELPSSLCKVGKMGNVYPRTELGYKTQAREAQYKC